MTGRRHLLPKGLRITKGGRKLAKYLDLSGLGVVGFAAKAGVSRVTLRQVIKGQRWKYISADFALDASAASDGMIKPEDFHSTTATDADEEPRLQATGSYG